MLVPPPGSDCEGAGAVFEGAGVVVEGVVVDGVFDGAAELDGVWALSALEPVVVVLALLPSV
jgi:hypothetical protein